MRIRLISSWYPISIYENGNKKSLSSPKSQNVENRILGLVSKHETERKKFSISSQEVENTPRHTLPPCHLPPSINGIYNNTIFLQRIFGKNFLHQFHQRFHLIEGWNTKTSDSHTSIVLISQKKERKNFTCPILTSQTGQIYSRWSQLLSPGGR